MPTDGNSPFLTLLKNRINLQQIPFSERGSRLLIFRSNHHLAVRLAERWFKREGQLAAYRTRPPLIEEFLFTDAEGRRLDFQLTTYPHRIDCQTTSGTFVLTLVDSESILVILPAGRCGVSFRANLNSAQTDRRGGILRVVGDIRRNIAYTCNARILENAIEPSGADAHRVRLTFDAQEGATLLLNITPRLGFNRWAPNPAEALEASAQRWHDWFAGVPPVADAYKAQYYFAWWIMRAGLIS